MANYLVALDTETGGLDPVNNTLLEVALVVMDDRGTILDEFQASLLPKDGVYRVTPKAMEINNIDLRTHAAEALLMERAAQQMVALLDQYRWQGGPLTLVGENVNFDRDFLRHQLLGFDEVRRLFGYQTMDLHAVRAFLAAAGKLPYTKTLEDTARFFNLVAADEKQEHRALADTRLTARVYREMQRFLS